MPRTVPESGNWRTTSAQPAYNITATDLVYDRRTLTWINRNPSYQYYAGGSLLQFSAPKVAWFTFYDAAGDSIGNYAIGNYESFGGSPRVGCGSTITGFSTSVNQELISLRVGPKDLADLNVWTSLGEVAASYTVQLFGSLNIAGDCTATGQPTTPLSEAVTIKVGEDCTSLLYPRVRLVWLNSLGGREYWNFTMFAEETITTKGTEYYQPEIQWSKTTPVVKSNDPSGNTTDNWLHGGTRSVNKVVENQWTISSDWLTQDEVELLKESVMSSQTWAYIGQDDFPYTCKIKEQSYTVKTIKQVKLFLATFTIAVSTDRTMQIV